MSYVITHEGRYANAQGAEVVWGSFAYAQVFYTREAAEKALARIGYGAIEELRPNNW